MSEEVHHHHHTDPPPLSIDVKVAHTTRGDTWEIEVKGAPGPVEAVNAFLDTRMNLTPHLATTGPEIQK